MDKNEIQNLYISIVEKAYQKIFYKFSPFYGECLEDIYKYIKEYALNINKYLYNSKDFEELLKTPQVMNLLNDCLESLILSELVEEKSRKIVIADNCINYCLEIIEKNYPNISDSDSLMAIKEFFELLFNTKEIIKSLYLNKKFESKYRIFLKVNDKQKIIKDEIYLESIKRVENELSITFTREDKKFEIVKNTYQKALKQIYQMGFIYFVGEFKFNDFYIPPILIGGVINGQEKFIKQIIHETENFKRIRENWKNIFFASDIVYVIGGAGYGKSLFLRNVINNYTKINIENSQSYLLIYCDLKTFYSNGNSYKKTVIDFLQESMIAITGVSNITQEFIQYFINRGSCIILLDALDEVPKEVRSELHKKIVGYFSTCNPNNKICITSRDRGFIPQESIEVFHICPLTSIEIEEYLDKMILLKKFKKEDKATFLEQAQILIDKEFLNNFLILSLLVNIYKAEKELPENKIDLYKKCFDYIAKKREEEKSKIGYDWENIYPLMKDSTFISLSTLAAPNNSDIKREDVENLLKKQYKTKYTDEAEAECAIKEFLEFCSNRTELFVPSAVDDKFKFFHRSFFEYFYARYIHQQSSIEEMYMLMTKFDIDSEVFELTVALVKEDNEMKYQDLLDYIFEKVYADFANIHPDFNAFGILTLAMQVVDDKYYIDKFYNIILNYSKLMKNVKVSVMNQRLLQMWVQKGIGDSEERKQEFRNIYEAESIKFILDIYAQLKRENNFKEKIIVNRENFTICERDITLGKGIVERGIVERGMRSTSFIISVYQHYFDINQTLGNFKTESFTKWINNQDIFSRKEKSILKKGLQIYSTLNPEDCEYILQLILR